MRDILFHETSQFCIYTSPCLDRASGGVITLIRSDVVRRFCTSTPVSIVDGRVLRVTLDNPEEKVFLYNVHNYGLVSQDLDIFLPMLSADIDSSASSPHSVAVVVAGDFNFHASGESSHSIATPSPARVRAQDNFERNRLRDVLERLTEIQQCTLPTTVLPPRRLLALIASTWRFLLGCWFS
jgi:hypothetical protein